MPAKEFFGVIADDRTYTAEQLAAIVQKSVRQVKDFVRANVKHHEPWQGCLLVSGRYWRLAIESLSEFDTAEAKAKRQKRGRRKIVNAG